MIKIAWITGMFALWKKKSELVQRYEDAIDKNGGLPPLSFINSLTPEEYHDLQYEILDGFLDEEAIKQFKLPPHSQGEAVPDKRYRKGDW